MSNKVIRRFYLALAVCMLAACATPEQEAVWQRQRQYQAEQARANYMAALDSKCSGYGFAKGTTAFSNCLMQQDSIQTLQEQANVAQQKRLNYRNYLECINSSPSGRYECPKAIFCGFLDEKC